ncbi:MAG: hypothetical protein ACYC8T_37120, partial [Myxococcaceae bacterium]
MPWALVQTRCLRRASSMTPTARDAGSPERVAAESRSNSRPSTAPTERRRRASGGSNSSRRVRISAASPEERAEAIMAASTRHPPGSRTSAPPSTSPCSTADAMNGLPPESSTNAWVASSGSSPAMDAPSRRISSGPRGAMRTAGAPERWRSGCSGGTSSARKE